MNGMMRGVRNWTPNQSSECAFAPDRGHRDILLFAMMSATVLHAALWFVELPVPSPGSAGGAVSYSIRFAMPGTQLRDDDTANAQLSPQDVIDPLVRAEPSALPERIPTDATASDPQPITPAQEPVEPDLTETEVHQSPAIDRELVPPAPPSAGESVALQSTAVPEVPVPALPNPVSTPVEPVSALPAEPDTRVDEPDFWTRRVQPTAKPEVPDRPAPPEIVETARHEQAVEELPLIEVEPEARTIPEPPAAPSRTTLQSAAISASGRNDTVADSQEEPDQTSSVPVAESAVGADDNIPLVTSPVFAEPPTPPEYPPTARRRHEEGTVVFRVLVSSTGRSEEVRVWQSSGFNRLDNAAELAVRKWRFRPAMHAGMPTRSWVEIPVNFYLN
ncbi:MAG: TonB family protein [Alphaproteobacteria bacterium]